MRDKHETSWTRCQGDSTPMPDFSTLGLAIADAWTWVERAAWVAAIVGFPLAVYQVAALRRELTRRPEFAVGFSPVEELGQVPYQTLRPAATTALKRRTDGAIEVELAICNNGERSAREMLINVSFPRLSLDQVAPDLQEIGLHPIRGYPWLVTNEPRVIHPHDALHISIGLRPPADMSAVVLTVEISSEDAPPFVKSLEAVIEQE